MASKQTPIDRYLKEKKLTKEEFKEFLRKENISEAIAYNIIWFHYLTPLQKLAAVEKQAEWTRKVKAWNTNRSKR